MRHEPPLGETCDQDNAALIDNVGWVAVAAPVCFELIELKLDDDHSEHTQGTVNTPRNIEARAFADGTECIMFSISGNDGAGVIGAETVTRADETCWLTPVA